MNTDSNTEYLSASQVMQRYGGVSHMWIVRKQSEAGFPPPVYFGGRLRFWKISALAEWERKTIARGPETTKVKPPQQSKRRSKTRRAA